ncbi:MAG: hypothetical protein EA397_10135 [Deltaproteobacteria bacterium]|nr:MAG: hypothetical protein EA397_10135 [Deltaproteobacteria bacterium]
MKGLVTGISVVIGVLVAGLVVGAVVFFAIDRGATLWIAISAAIVLLFGPPVAIALRGPEPLATFGAASTLWGGLVALLIPLLLPALSIREEIAGLLVNAPRELAEPLARPEPPPARPLPAPTTATDAPAVEPNQIALHYEGEGRRMTVDITVEHDGVVEELQMLLDTGATFTTLSTEQLARLGLRAGPEHPRITLQTANGERQASLLLLDRLWLGDLVMEGIAIATCDACASSEIAGLLGLNVTGGYNLSIDADHQEVIFTRRADYSRHLDIKPFVEIGANIRTMGGRVSAEPWLDNLSPRTLRDAEIALRCEDEAWVIEIGSIPPGERGTADRRLPSHEPCDRYQVTLRSASW